MTGDEMDALLALVERRLGAAWVRVVTHLAEQNGLDAIEARLAAGDIDGAIQGVADAAATFAGEIHAGFVTAATQEASFLDTQLPDALVRFDQVNVRAVAWAQQNQASLVQGLVAEQRQVVTQVVSDGIRAGTNPRAVARDLRASIGLTPYQAEQVASYRRSLESGDFANALGRELSDGRSDRTIAAARAAGRPLTDAQVDLAVERYRTGWVNYRAETIARTEGLRATHEGSDEAVRQAVQRGNVDAGAVVRTWVTAKDKRTRASHRAMSGQKRGLDEPFVSGEGSSLMYPGDPSAPPSDTISCRCVVATRLTG